MKENKRLENYRYESLGRVALQCIIDEKFQSMIYYEEDVFVYKAIELTLDSFRQLEFSSTYFNPGRSSLSAVVMWFLSLESFFAKITKIICLYTKKDFKKFQNHHICSRIDLICDCVGINKVLFQKSKIRNMLQEFNEIRNSIFHAGNFQKRLKIKHTIFSDIPVFVNQSDVIQAADIAINIMAMFRFVFKGIDIIPQLPIQDNKKMCAKYIALEEFYNGVIKKSFFEILKKHDLCTSFTPLETTHLDQKYVLDTNIHPLLKAKEDIIALCNNEKTNIIDEITENFSRDICSDLAPDIIKVYNAYV